MSSLVKLLVAGDSKTVVEFYRIFSPKILSYLIKKLPTREDAQEITNDVFLETLDSISLLKDERKVLNWLYKIAHNKTVDFYRKKKIKAIILSQSPFLQIVANEINQPEFQFEKDRIRDKIESALYSLSHNYRKILRLHYEDKISVKRLAIIFNLSFKAAESLLFRARQSFKLAYERA
ncbi:MAG: hypothetical protein A3H50_02850 [Candidatus Levybacteria bacterium RIFCSPLOWO2_02_FULL_37_10]|nr:MAG: hypothetical protein A2860_01775 [Candidatus Levybacteria bacterium RIFCSPHIGHO2_01_FULL_37_33]OGH15760.1 MAG: hypothetical protein A3C97_01125 [Candidatus Levybacteria bacterium RIFCSPHIGHO2_02_FULL_37_11]OGH29662.1 MAG: hypothetical protein A3F30_02855 [Candidatus Levybacteria bacterium RIFCSPHIGHO2_12_FULL_37_12]OGH32588.1 MAG: hypothetical protein A2953_02370 [Candidatus Levybacteria bacterium RIFCSPLOWO2_01_FULL_36_54]OGH43202.1 MAG: hypothetical protein A3H50_02850 [Candidatus Lev